MSSYEGEQVRCKIDFFFFLMLSDQFTLIEGLSLLETKVLFDHALGTSLTAGTTAAYQSAFREWQRLSKSAQHLNPTRCFCTVQT